VGGSFVAACFEESGAFGKGDRLVGLEKVEESERGSGEDDGLVELKEGSEMELAVAEQKWGSILWIKRLVELLEHVDEGGAGIFFRRRAQERERDIGKAGFPMSEDGQVIEGGGRKVMSPFDLGGGAGGEEGGGSG